ncbi:FeoC-like transcriptional regulator [Oceanirhabdus seepicola]|uniref:Transcriptional regulator HTH-type FeoC domain-containing protein n=1 Tax=Oceanirhabdus seepicola TaxID=2828781 RepID=A0A9J6P5P9_9CLOT|nr:FeoC-like transcriptional regulator [Oceanirhabdus seepicola]MCM1991915.1 hypothetical protein [Oceanirhabdus seepicola]
MLMKILRAIYEGTASITMIANKLNINKAIVEQMIENLINMGYIRKASLSCDTSACAKCSSKSSCGSGCGSSDIYFYQVTDKGKKALA